jgi:hypothetical protein
VRVVVVCLLQAAVLTCGLLCCAWLVLPPAVPLEAQQICLPPLLLGIVTHLNIFSLERYYHRPGFHSSWGRRDSPWRCAS